MTIKLTNEWQAVAVTDAALEAMVKQGLAWRSFEVVGNLLVARYCLAHDVSETEIPNDHART